MNKLWGHSCCSPTPGEVCFHSEPHSIAGTHRSAYLAVLHPDGSNGADSVGLRVEERIRSSHEQTSGHHLDRHPVFVWPSASPLSHRGTAIPRP